MKAKRLRALLVAGLLSLAPAVTLTSCGGGGGGGGGGGAIDQLPESIVGRTLTVTNEDASICRVSFKNYGNCDVVMEVDGVGAGRYEGHYNYNPGSEQTEEHVIVLMPTGDALLGFTLAVVNSKLKLTRVVMYDTINEEFNNDVTARSEFR